MPLFLTKVIIHINLSDRHPFKIRPHRIHFPLVNADATILDERFFGVVETGGPVTVAIVGNLVIVPDGDPSELLVREKQVEIGTVGGKTTPVVVQCEDFSLGLDGTGGGRGCIFVDVVTELRCCQLSILATTG